MLLLLYTLITNKGGRMAKDFTDKAKEKKEQAENKMHEMKGRIKQRREDKQKDTDADNETEL
jgi:galactokinase/mevalonate kinase-like predicted kinase